MQTLLRKVGFEVEFTNPVNPLESMARTMTRQGEAAGVYNGYRHSTGDTWDLKVDGSCGYEVASPVITTYDELIRAATIVETIRNHGGSVNDRCGLHVHVDMNGITSDKFELVMRFMGRYEAAFFLLADPWRQNNTFCQKLSGQVEQVRRRPDEFRSVWHAKHYWLNGTHLRGQGTLEFRLMASHLEAEYIVGWVLFLVHCIDYLLKGKQVCWGKAVCATERDLLQTMLGQAGFYGPFNDRDKPTIVAARKWAIDTYTAKTAQSDRRVKRLTMAQLALLGS